MLSINPKEVITPNNLIEAFHNYHNHLALSVSPLANLPGVRARLEEPGKKTVSPSPLGAALAAELKSLIASLEPKDALLPQTHPRRYAYEVLHQTVVLGRSATDTAARLYISRSQLYRIREKAISDLCQLWQERELLRNEQDGKGSSSESLVSGSEEKKTTDIEAITVAEPAKRAPVMPEIPTPETSAPEQETKNSKLETRNSELLTSGFRIVNVLVANLTGFNRITVNLDLESAHELVGRILGVLDEVLKESDGYVNRWYERGVSAFFGAPASHEDDPVRTVRAALRLQTALAELKDKLPDLPPQLRRVWPNLKIGIGSGRVFAGMTGTGPTAGNSPRYTVTGQALDVAANLVEQAPAGWILIDHATYRLVRGMFEIVALNTSEEGELRTAEAAEEPLDTDGPVYRVLKERPQGFLIGVRDIHGVEVNMVGREPEWNMLTGLYQEARYNRTIRQVTVSGAAGSGKSRLEYEFRKYLELQPHLTRYWRGQVVQEGRLPYQPFAEMLRDKAGILESDSADMARQRLLEMCQPFFVGEAPLWSNAVALSGSFTRADEVAHLLSVMLDLSWPDSPFLEALAKTSPQVAQAQTFRAFANLCEQVAHNGEPLVLVLEDLHWAQETTLALWNYLSAELAEESILLLGLTRPELYERKPDWGLGLDRHIRLDLKPLSPARTRELVRHILREVENLPDELVESIVQVADGNPFYVEEIIKMLLDNGVLAIDQDGNWKLGVSSHGSGTEGWTSLFFQPLTPNPQPLVMVPSTIEGLIQARMDRLPAFDRQLVGLAAVAGRVFSEEALEYLLTNPTVRSTLGRMEGFDDVQAGLRRLQQRELITRKPDRALPGASSQNYLFRHSLLREIVYNNMPQKVRAPLHRTLADWLAADRDRSERRNEQGTAVAIAEHYERAGLNRRAATFYEEAGDEARAAYALRDAVNLYQKALDLLSLSGEVTGRSVVLLSSPPGPGDGVLLKEMLDQGDGSSESSTRVRVLEKKGRAETALGQYPAALNDFALALDLIAPNETGRRVELQLLRGDVFWRNGSYTQGLQEATTALAELGTESGAIWARLQTLVGSLYFRQGRYDEAIRTILKALDELQRLEGSEPELDPVQQERIRRALADSCRNLGLVYWGQGSFKLAAEYLEKALNFNQQRGDLFGIADCLDFRGLIHRDSGEYPQANQCFQQARTIFKQIGDQQRYAYCHANLGIVAWRLGKLDEAAEYQERALAIYKQVGGQFGLASCYNSLGIVARERGRLDEALDLCEKSMKIADAISDLRGLAYSYHYIGVVYHDRGELENAAELFRRSLAIREKVGHQLGVAESLLRLGRLYLDRGAFEQGRELTENGLAIFEKISPYGLSYGYSNLGLYHLLQEDCKEAAPLFQQALGYAEKLGLTEAQTLAYLGTAKLALAQGKPAEEVSGSFERVIEFAAGRYPLLIASAYLGQAELFLREGTPLAALDATREGHTIVAEKGYGLLVSRSYRIQAQALRALGRQDEAREAFELSRRAAHEAGQQYELELTERVAP